MPSPRTPLLQTRWHTAWAPTSSTASPSDEAAARLLAAGPNQLESPSRPRYLSIAGRQLADPLVALLLAAAVISFAIGEGIEAAVIAVIVVLNGVLGFVQEASAERAVLALGAGVEEPVSVLRDGRQQQIPVAAVVPGDVVRLREGGRVPADARIGVAEGLAVDESALTGESVPVSKTAEPVPEEAPLAERFSLVYAGTGVTRGRGTVVVIATGPSTEMGQVATLVAAAKPPPTPLQRQLGNLSRLLALLGVGLTVVLALGMLAQGSPPHEAFLVGVAVAVAAVPEGLAAVVTIALSQGAREMARRGAIVRSLSAIETIGEATVIATDKTGTLTLNQLRVVEVEPAPGRIADDVVLVGALASGGEVFEEEGERRFSATRSTWRSWWRRPGAAFSASGAGRLAEIPFDPERKRAVAVYDHGGRKRVAMKGAHEILLDLGSLHNDERAALDETADRWAESGLRVLAVGERWPDEDVDDDDLEQGVEILGLVALQDPLRPTSREAVRAARTAGIDVVMVTGDHPTTAAAIARDLDLDQDRVHARVTPTDKLRLVESLQQEGHVVAVTGDGINDAPALRRADVGVAMGLSGTEAARQAAEIVLTDDDFATILAAVREGRIIGDNVRKFVAFLLSANFGEVVLFAIAVLAGLGAPMTVVQVLTVNLLTDGLPAIALTRDPASPATMRRPPTPLGRLFSRDQIALLAVAGTAIGIAATVAYVVGRDLAPDAAQTMAFATVALAELVFVYSIRSPSRPAWRGPRNHLLALSVTASAAVVFVCIYVPFARDLLGAEPLSATELGIVLALAIAPSVLVETTKALRRAARSRRE